MTLSNDVKNIYACVALHNFIKVHRGDIDDPEDDGADIQEVQAFDDLVASGASNSVLYHLQAAVAKREAIAQEMWSIKRSKR